jgi:hypothetical protein
MSAAVMFAHQPPAMAPVPSPAAVVITYRLQVPFGSLPSNVEPSVAVPPPAGPGLPYGPAGAGAPQISFTPS